MSSAYPDGFDNFATNWEDDSTMRGEHPPLHNNLAAAINAIQQALGLDPTFGVSAISVSAEVIGVPNQLNIEFQTDIPSDPQKFSHGNFSIPLYIAGHAYDPGVIATFGSASASQIDTRNDNYDLNVRIDVVNDDTTETLTLQGGTFAGASIPNDSVSVSSSRLSVQSQVGSDLSYNASNGEISSSGGGFYSIKVTISGNWD